MRPRLSVSRSAVELIKAFEGFRAKAARLDDGGWTIGYGHTLTAREGAVIGEPDAEALLLYDLIAVSHAVNELVFVPLTQNQFDALVSFVFNIGVRSFRGSSTYRRLNEGRLLEAALSMEMWRKSDLEGERIVVDALVRRRAAEKALFLRPMGGWIPAPTPVLPPKFDYDAVTAMPLQTPIATKASMGGERAFAERVAEPAFEPPEPPSASAAAAEAVIGRLEAILAEPATETRTAEPPAKTTSETAAEPSQAPATEAADTAAHALFISPTLREKRPRRLHPLALLMLAAVGVGLFMVAAVWGFEPTGSQALGVPAQTAGFAVGGLGVICFAVAVYFLLERLGLPRDRDPS